MTDRPRTHAPDPEQLILTTLEGAWRRSAFVSELAAAARTTGVDPRSLEHSLEDLERSGRIVVADHRSPDVHLDGTDLRTVSAVADSSPVALARAREMAEARWQEFLRSFLASHRCS